MGALDRAGTVRRYVIDLGKERGPVEGFGDDYPPQDLTSKLGHIYIYI